MAGDWIRFRSDLWTHPRFISLSNSLIYCEEGHLNVGFLSYVCGNDALELDVHPPSNESITARALRCVTKEALETDRRHKHAREVPQVSEIRSGTSRNHPSLSLSAMEVAVIANPT